MTSKDHATRRDSVAVESTLEKAEPLIGAVLVGGQSRRFGRDKATSEAGDRLLGQRVVDALREAGLDPVVAVGGTAGSALGIPTVADRHPGAGPLAALATVLSWAKTGLVVVVPCDLPLLEAAHINALVAGASEERAAIAMLDGMAQPSVGCWPARFAPALQRAFGRGERAWQAAMDAGPYVLVPLPAVALADADTPGRLAELLADHGPEQVTDVHHPDS